LGGISVHQDSLRHFGPFQANLSLHGGIVQ
jgi:hypothetical protein